MLGFDLPLFPHPGIPSDVVAGPEPATSPFFAINGDSRTQQAVSGARSYLSGADTNPATNGLGYTAASWVTHMFRVMGHRTALPPGCQFAIGAERTDHIAARAARDATQAAALGAKVLIFLGGVNDGTALTVAQSIANYTTIFTAFAAAGLRLVVLNELPRSGLTGDALTRHLARRDWLADPQRETDWPGLVRVDSFNALLKAGTQGDYRDGESYDGLHPNYIGHKRLGEAVGTALSGLYPTAAFASRLTLPGATTTGDFLNPARCLMTGTGGTATWGPVATGYALSSSLGALTLVAAKGTDPDGYDEQILSLSGSNATDAAYTCALQDTSPTTPVSALPAGTKLRLNGRVRLDAGHSGMLGVNAELIVQGTNLTTASSGFALITVAALAGTWAAGSTNFLMNGEAEDFRFQTPPLVLPANWAAATGRQCYLRIRPMTQGNGQAVSATVRISRLGVFAGA